MEEDKCVLSEKGITRLNAIIKKVNSRAFEEWWASLTYEEKMEIHQDNTRR